MILSLLLVAGWLFSGCSTTDTVCDLRGETPEVCPIHHLYMRSEEIPNPHRTTPPSFEYVDARRRYFVHAKPTLYALPDKCTRCVVWVCDQCEAAEQKWRAAHPGIAP